MTTTARHLTDPAEREACVRMLAAVRAHRDEMGGVVIPTWLLLNWLDADGGRADVYGLDPDGLHLARRMFLHNDTDWRLEVAASRTGATEPLLLMVDVTMDDWDEGRHATDLLIAHLHDHLN